VDNLNKSLAATAPQGLSKWFHITLLPLCEKKFFNMTATMHAIRIYIFPRDEEADKELKSPWYGISPKTF
jgi:hypothetical protein